MLPFNSEEMQWNDELSGLQVPERKHIELKKRLHLILLTILANSKSSEILHNM